MGVPAAVRTSSPINGISKANIVVAPCASLLEDPNKACMEAPSAVMELVIVGNTSACTRGVERGHRRTSRGTQ